ncbi:fungal-specific transcription factor domain-containing protein [Penicillium cosmopolitanum]|uniref:Fungal-specific transcription factor domain-containing protein n=1 Tax=Penicillium cosmopolitanum TaxID=1131564 RepID=A0A9X0B447_9EURO|nr:fungal-specific transcription factor domain-containing protein [Penicillium cosmopolitanum]KAJ5387412.1 fungal-specific transcription factor domain-containing protein [Penicillium cosmopolitanum]
MSEYAALRRNVSSGGGFPVPSMLSETASEPSQGISDQSVVFSYYEFLELKALPKLLSADVKYLESKGCFRVPGDSYLGDFMQEYFLHVHPCLPILNEGDFWNLYGQMDTMIRASKVSLLVLQAMLFAASAFVPLRTLRACGFRDSHEARERLHQRAALLYQFQSESNLASIAQASLLLSFQSSARDVQNNTSFLSTAIQCARADRAHLYSVLPQLSARERQDKKRLWWCCLVRDRIIALGVRRPLQITPDQFDHHREPFAEQDLACEIGRSRVYDSETKRSLIKIFVTQCELAAALTSTIMIIYPLDSVPMSLSHTSPDLVGLSGKMKSCRQDLSTWFDAAEARLKHNSGKDVLRVDFVTLYADLLRLYYYSAQMALGHFIIYTFSRSHTVNPDWMMQLNTSKSDLKAAFTGLKGVFKRLVTSNLAGHLPISASAYTALPLLLGSLDVWLSPSDHQKKTRMRDLSHCVAAMRQYESRFSFAKFVSEIISSLSTSRQYVRIDLINIKPPTSNLE